MLTDPIEKEIIAKARQKNVRDPSRSREHFERIFKDFLGDVDLNGQLLLDLGPGQFDFGVMARERKATVVGIDNDPAVLELGRHKGFKIIEGQIQKLNPDDFPDKFDGIFCKFSINAFWFHDDFDELRKSVNGIVNLMKPDAWAWIAPWNGAPKNANLSENQIREVLSVQRDEFVKHGFQAFNLTTLLAKRYGIHGTTANMALFARNVSIPKKIAGCSW